MGYLFLFIILMFGIYAMWGGTAVLVIIGALIVLAVVVYVPDSEKQKEIKTKLDDGGIILPLRPKEMELVDT